MAQEANIIMTNGVTIGIKPKNGTDFSLEELQTIVDGHIEVLRLTDEQIMIVNEEGKLNGLSFNAKATRMVREAGYDDFIVGDVLVCHTNMVK